MTTRPGLGNLRNDPLLENLYGDPRWNAFLQAMGLSGEQVKTGTL